MALLPFKTLQDRVLLPTSGGRFKEALRPNAKDWIRNVYRGIWDADEWAFKQNVQLVTVTAGSQLVTGLPGNVGLVHALLNAQGAPLTFRPWRDFERLHYGDTGQTQPYDYTIIGSGPGLTIKVAPISSETSSLYELLHEMEPGWWPSTTTTGSTTLPAATINVTATAQFPSSGTVLIGGRPVTFTGKTSNTLTGCAGGIGTFAAGEPVICISSPQVGDLSGDTDVPMLPDSEILVRAALALGQSNENDYSMYLSDDRVQQMLDQMRRRYTRQAQGETEQWGSNRHAAAMDGWPWRP